LSALSICAVFAANPRAIPRSVIRIMQGKAEEIRMPVLLCSACLCNHCTTRITSRTSFDPGNGVSFCSDQNAGPRALTFFPSREKNSMLLSPPDCVRLVASLTSPLSGSTQRMIVSTPHLFGIVRAAGAIRPAIVFNAALLFIQTFRGCELKVMSEEPGNCRRISMIKDWIIWVKNPSG
jgi:hypothetical protein